MAAEYKAALTVNDKAIEITGFPEEFLAKTLAGAVSSLKKAEEIKNLELTMAFGKVKLNVNGNQIPLGPFPNLVITNTLIGMVATLKGVEGKVTTLEIKMQAA
jgi:hypothetical protein